MSIPELTAATAAAEWLLRTASRLHVVLDRRRMSRLPADLGGGLLKDLKQLQDELYPGGTAGPGEREKAIRSASPRLDRYGPLRFGSVHAANAHEAAVGYARHVLSLVNAAAWRAGRTRKPLLAADDLRPEDFPAVAAEYTAILDADADPPDGGAVGAALRSEASKALHDQCAPLRDGFTAPAEPALRLRVADDGRVTLDGRPVPLDLTAEAREQALVFLRRLIAAAGGWLSGPDIERGVRWDRVRKSLPQRVQDLIQTDRRKGNRLSEKAWRK
jgi:hypothetical protein